MKTPLLQGISNLLLGGFISAFAIVAQAVMIAGYLVFHLCNNNPSEAYELAAAGMLPAPRAVLVAAAWIGASNVLVVILVARLWFRRRADVLHNRGAEVIDRRKGK